MLMKCSKLWISAIWWKKLGKNGTELSQKKLIFSETHVQFDGRLAVSKLMDTQLTNQTFLQRMKEQILQNTAS